MREAEVSTAPEHLPRWIFLALPPFAAPLAAAAWLRAHWDEIPQRFPVHFDFAGHPSRWMEKSARGVYGPLLAGTGLLLAILLLGLATFYGARRGRQRVAVLKMVVASLYFLAYVFTSVSFLAVGPPSMAAILAPPAIFTAILLMWSFKLARDPDMPVDNTPDEFWKLGSIYYNPHDPAIFVQRRMGFGYTFNFANPVAWIGIGIFVIFLVVFVLLMR